MALGMSPQCRAFWRAVMDEKSLNPLFPVGVGGVAGGVLGQGSGVVPGYK